MYQKTYGHSFAQSVLQSKCTNMQMKPTALEQMKAKHQIQRECRDQISQQFNTTDALTVLPEAQSLASYQWQRLTQSFESPQCTRARVSKAKKHSPKFENVQWDKENLLVQLKNLPQGQIINWSALARKFNIPGRNNGQVVKEFAVENGIDVFMLDHRPSTTRLRKLRMPGGQISVPAHRTVEEDWKRMIELGELTLGEPCYPQTLCKYTIKGGELQYSETIVYGRKIPLIEVERKLLKKHECLTHSDEEIACFTKSHLLELYKQHHIQLLSNLSEETLQSTLKQYDRTRSIALWHDHSTILGRGYILLTVKVLYGPAVFNSSSNHKCTGLC